MLRSSVHAVHVQTAREAAGAWEAGWCLPGGRGPAPSPGRWLARRLSGRCRRAEARAHPPPLPPPVRAGYTGKPGDHPDRNTRAASAGAIKETKVVYTSTSMAL